MDKDFMAEGQKSQFKQDEQEVFVENQEELHGVTREQTNNDPLDEIVDELNKTKEQLLRVTADFANFKKRSLKEREEWQSTTLISVVKPFLNIIDDFERALSLKEESEKNHAWIEGFSMIHKNLLKQLDSLGVKEIKADEGFNPLFHEALLLLEKEGYASGTIIEVLRKGYLYNDTIIRCAQVSVAK